MIELPSMMQIFDDVQGVQKKQSANSALNFKPFKNIYV